MTTTTKTAVRLPILPQAENLGTQPLRTFPVFNNWDVVAQGWYAACLSAELPKNRVAPFTLHGQRLVIFRGEDGTPRALDSYCPHMGTDLSIGKVVGNHIECYFHHWQFDGRGACAKIPCQEGTPPPAAARTQGYATCERYGWVWVWPGAEAPETVVEFTELLGQELEVWQDAPIERTCHHHVGMINGIDPQHLRTVHNLNIDMHLSLDESKDGRVIDFVLRGEVPSTNVFTRAFSAAIGGHYSYGMRYADANVGLLTTWKDLRWRGGGFQFPQLYMVYAYTPLAEGRTRVQPIFVTKKRPGVLGWLTSRGLLWATKQSYRMLQHEDGRVYDNMRFSPKALLPIDGPVAKFIAYVNRLPPSVWSKSTVGKDSLAEAAE